jgi:hypothetical protein
MPLDIASGIFLSLLTAEWFGVHVSAGFIFFGILSTLLPDIDMLSFLSRIGYDHRSFFHWPLMYIPIAIAVFFVCGTTYATLFSFCILAHFIHDSIGIGWGVGWLAPFSMRKILFPEKGRRQEYGWFMTWLPDEEGAMAVKYHDPHWIRTYYFRVNKIAIIEYGALILSIFILFVYYRGL